MPDKPAAKPARIVDEQPTLSSSGSDDPPDPFSFLEDNSPGPGSSNAEPYRAPASQSSSMRSRLAGDYPINKMLGIGGGVGALLGVFLPFVSVIGLVSLSYFDLLNQGNYDCLFVLGGGGAAIALALTEKYKQIKWAGIVTLIGPIYSFAHLHQAKAELQNNPIAVGVTFSVGFFLIVVAGGAMIAADLMTPRPAKASRQIGHSY